MILIPQFLISTMDEFYKEFDALKVSSKATLSFH